MRRNVREVRDRAVVVDARARVHDAVLADARSRVDDRAGHDDRSRADFRVGRNHRARVNRRRETHVPARAEKLDHAAARLVFPDAHDRRSRGSVRAAHDGQPAEFAQLRGIVAHAVDRDVPRAQNVENHLGVSARSVEEKHLSARLRGYFFAALIVSTTRATSSSVSDEPEGRQSPRAKIFSETPLP